MLASIIREIIAPVLTECPQECGIVSITAVEVSSDFSHATVYVSALYHAESAVAFLQEHQFALQKSLSQLYRKRIPILRFRKDGTIEQGEKIDALLKT